MSHPEESLDEKIARIRKQNEAIERRKKMIDEEIRDAERNNAIVKLKNQTVETEEDKKFGATLYSDQLSPDKKVARPHEDDVWSAKPRQKRPTSQSNSTDQEWREERKRIDEERIRRQKANSGSWKREWDADKTSTSNDHDDRTSRDMGNRFNRSSSTTERPENRGAYNFNELKGSFNHYSSNEDDNSQSRWKADNSFRKSHSERWTSDNYNRKPIKTDNWKSNVSETDKYNNNAAKQFSKNIIRADVQGTFVPTKNDHFEEESWDTVKSYPKNNSRNTVQNTSFVMKNHQLDAERRNVADSFLKNSCTSGIQNTAFTTKNGQFRKENWDVKPVVLTQALKPKSNEKCAGGDVNPEVKVNEKQLSSVAHNISKSFSFNNRTVLSSKPSNTTKLWACKSPENKHRNIGKNNAESNCSEESSLNSKDLKNIVVQVGNLGISADKREVRVCNDLKSNTNVPNFSFNLNTSQEVDSKTLPNYNSMTFERSDLKQKVTPIYLENLSLPTSITTQMFSNSKMSDNNYLANINTKSSDFVNNVKQETFAGFQSPAVFQFSATPSKPDFGDIVHNTTTSQDVQFTRTIRCENIVLRKESPKKDIYNESRKVKSAKVVQDNRKKVHESRFKEVVVKKKESDVELSDEEWDDCSDEDVEEEFV